MASINVKDLDPAFQSAGSFKPGLEIWRIEDFKVAPVPRSAHGAFHTGDSYIVLKITALKNGSLNYAIHFWLGRETTQDESGTAAIKSIELDAALGGRAPQHREVEGHESDLFLSYFRPALIALPGGKKSGFKTHGTEQPPPRLFQLKGKRFVRVRQVPIARSSLTHFDIFILDTPSKLFQFNGIACSKAEKGKALEIMQAIKDKDHTGPCQVAIIEDGRSDDDDSGEFWGLLGGFGPIPNKRGGEEPLTATKLMWASPSGLQEVGAGAGLKRAHLESHKVFVLDCGAEIFVWSGRIAPLPDRKLGAEGAENLIRKSNRPPSTRVTRVTERYETPMFKSNFDDWPAAPTAPLGGGGGLGGEGKVKDLLKAAGGGVDIKALAKGGEDPDQLPPLLPADTQGKMEVWRVTGADKEAIPPSEFGRFYSGDCYLILYTYPRERKNEYLLVFWIGRNCTIKAKSLSSSDCFVLQTASVVYTWVGGSSTEASRTAAQAAAQLLKPGVGVKQQVEGKEVAAFWAAVGGKGEYGGGREEKRVTVHDPRLFACSTLQGGDLKVVEVYHFVQDDLTSEDVMILDAGGEIWVWVGAGAEEREKREAFLLAVHYCEYVVKAEGRSADTPLMKVGEGGELPMFTHHFAWDDSKATSFVDPYERKLAALQGRPIELTEAQKRCLILNPKSPRPALPSSSPSSSTPPSSAASQRAAAMAALSGTLVGEKQKLVTTSIQVPAPPTPDPLAEAGGEVEEAVGQLAPTVHDLPLAADPHHIPYSRLTLASTNPAAGVDTTKRELYLSDAEFEAVMGMMKIEFYTLAKWKQDNKKKVVDLF